MYNFGQIKETYNKIYLESFSGKDKKKKSLFNFYLKKLRESEVLKEEFECYNAVQTNNFSDPLTSQLFIEQSINIIKNLNQEELKKYHDELIKTLNENNVKLISPSDEKITIFEELLNLENKSKNLNKLSESITKLRNSLVKEGSEQDNVNGVSLPTNVLSNLLVNKFNSKYSDLDEGSKNLIKVLLNGGENEKTELFNSTLKECVELVNNKLKESYSDLELKDKLLQTKERLLEMSFNNETYIENLTKMLELKDNL